MIALGIFVLFVGVWAFAVGIGLAMGAHKDLGVGVLVAHSLAMTFGLFAVLGVLALGGVILLLGLGVPA